MLTNLLAAGFDVAFNHYALYKIFNFFRVSTAVHNFFYDTDLLHMSLSRVGVISINNTCWIKQISFLIHFMRAVTL